MTNDCSVVAGDRLDGADHLLVRDLVGRAGEARVPAVHEDGAVALRVSPQGVDQLPPLGVVEGAEVHGLLSFPKKGTSYLRHAGRKDSPVHARPARSASNR